MRNFQAIIFIWTRTYREIFKSALVHLFKFSDIILNPFDNSPIPRSIFPINWWNCDATNSFCVWVKGKRLCLCSSCESASLIRNIGEFGAKNYFTDHRTANTIFRVYFFSEQVAANRDLLEAPDKYSHLFILYIIKIDIKLHCQKPAIRTSSLSQQCFNLDKFCFQQKWLELFLLMMCK